MAKKNTNELKNRWTKFAADRLVGRKIVGCRYLTEKETEAMGWHHSALVLVLDDGSQIFPSQDDEGNNAGALFGQGPKNEEWTFPVIRS